MDKRDLKILSILDFNARTSNSKIAKTLRISKPSVEYRINKLKRNKIIENYYTVVDIARLGFIPYRISIKLQNITDEKQKEILDYLKNCKSIGWLFSLGGKWDIALTIYARNILEFENISKRILSKITKNILEKTVSIVTSINSYPNKFLFYPKKDVQIVLGKTLENYEMDKLDQKILLELAQDARQPLLKIAEKLRQNPKTVSYRIKRMENKKIILGYRANINTAILGYNHYKIFLFLQNTTKETEQKIITHIKYMNNSIYYTSAVGIADMEFEIKVKNPEEVFLIVDDLRKNFEEYIKSFETILIRKEHLINYLPDIDS